MKTCTKCKEEKPLDQFHRRTRNKDGLNGSCKKCECDRTKAYSVDYRKTDAYRKKQQRYKKSDKGRDADKRYRESEKGKAVASSEQRKRYLKKWWKSAAGKAASKRYRESESGRARNIAKSHDRRVKLRRCEKPIDKHVLKYMALHCPDGHEIDHIYPVSKGGTNEWSNLCWIPASINKSKNNKTVNDFGRELFERHAKYPSVPRFLEWLIETTEMENA